MIINNEKEAYTPSDLARKIAAVFLPADWRLLNHSHYQKITMIEELLRNAESNAIDREAAVKVLQDARQRGYSDLRDLIAEIRSLPPAVFDTKPPPSCVCAIIPDKRCPIHVLLATASTIEVAEAEEGAGDG